MRRRIGLLGGVGYATTIEYYRRVMRGYLDRHADIDQPEMIVYSLSHGAFKRCEEAGDTAGYVSYIMQGIRGLVAAGADFIALAANSPHAVLDRLRDETPVPIVSALDSAAQGAIEHRMKKALLMGIRFTMQADFFQRRFAKDGIDLVTPNTRDQDEIQRIIDEELIHEVIREDSRTTLLEIACRQRVDGIVLGCMRLPAILRDGMAGLRVVDTLDRHVRDILDYALPGEVSTARRRGLAVLPVERQPG